MRRMRWALLVPVLCLAVASGSHAGTSATTLTVSATVGSACSISASALDFGNVGAGGPGTHAQTQLTLQCPVDLPYQVTMGAGLHPGSNPGERQVSFNGVALMTYFLCMDSGCTSVWGDGGFENTLPNFPPFGNTGTGSQQFIPVYGILLQPAAPTVGAYSDTVAVTVHF